MRIPESAEVEYLVELIIKQRVYYIIFRDKVFYIDRKSKEQYDEAKRYGISLGIPEYQVDFAPDDKIWER